MDACTVRVNGHRRVLNQVSEKEKMSNAHKKRRYFLPHDARSKTTVAIPLLLAKEMARLLLKCESIEAWQCRNSLTVSVPGRKCVHLA